MGMKQKQDCPLCEEELLSDATAAEYCALCSMIIRGRPARTIKTKQGTKSFCSDVCYEKFRKYYDAKKTGKTT